MARYTYDFAELDKDLFALLRRLGYRPVTIFDIGAANGFWSHHVSQIFPSAQFHLFEPLVDHVPEYRANIANNLAQHTLFALHKVAVGEVSGEAVLSIPPNAFASTVLVPDQAIRRVRVPVVSLDDVVRGHSLPCPQIMKIDVQGAELAVLQGARSILPEVDALLIECWLWRGYGNETPLLLEMMNWLVEVGFSLWDVGDSYRGPDGTLASLDCLFINSRTMASIVRGRVGIPRRESANQPEMRTTPVRPTLAWEMGHRVAPMSAPPPDRAGTAATETGEASEREGSPQLDHHPVDAVVASSPEDYRRQFAHECARHCPNVTTARVLVVGCGVGRDCQQFVDLGAQIVHGVDIGADVGQEWADPAVRYMCASAEALPFADGSYDVVYSIATMVRVQDVGMAFAEMVRVAKTKGLIYCVAAPLWSSREGHQQSGLFPDHPWIHLRLSPDQVLALARSRPHGPQHRDVSEDVAFMFSAYFNRLPARRYLEVCASLPVGHVIDNTVWLEAEQPRFSEVLRDLQDRGHARDELLAVAHKFIGRK